MVTTEKTRSGTGSLRLGIPGLMTIAACYGFGRYGYGLFLPQIRQEFGLSTGTLGSIASAGYVGALLALVMVNWKAAKWGPRPLVVAGGVSAGSGMAMVGIAPTPIILLAGVFLTGVAPGLVWAPYSDAVAATVAEDARDRSLSLISTGTSFGIMLVGPAALLATGTRWHLIWLLAAGITLLVTGWNFAVLPRRPHRSKGRAKLHFRGRLEVKCLLIVAFSAGLCGSTYWTFAAEFVSMTNHSTLPAAPIIWTLIGVVGFVGIFTGRLTQKLGLRSTYVICQAGLAASSISIAVVGSGWLYAVVSALLFGPAFMIVAALLSVWSLRVFPEQPARGFSFAVICLSCGSIAGPIIFGWIADHGNYSAVFLVTAVLAVASIAARPSSEPS